MRNIYQFTKTWPAHLSVGCVLLNEKKQVALLHNPPGSKYAKVYGRDFYLLMRETVEGNEPLTSAVKRGLLEEIGARAEVVAFLGTLQADFREQLASGVQMRKTTLYHLATLISINSADRKMDDHEKECDVVWTNLDKAVSIFEDQAAYRPGRLDLHEAQVIRWAKNYLAKFPSGVLP